MKRTVIILVSVILMTGLSSSSRIGPYDSDFVQVSTAKHNGYEYKVIYMERGRSGKRIKAKYFAAKDPYSNKTVPQRYNEWEYGKGVICVSSGTYMDSYTNPNPKPVGITVDNGIVVNRNLQPDMDGLVIVYATGGIVATNLEDKDLTVQGGSISGIPLDIRGNSFHLSSFLKWCEEQEATVFQTHMLIYKNELKISSYNSSKTPRERRFLAVGYDDDGNLAHCIIHSPDYTSLYEGTKRVHDFLNEIKELDVTFMVNLDTGAQDVFKLFNADGNEDNTIKGQKSLEEAVNLLVYYYE